MTSSSRPLVDRERAELADLLDRLGPDAPTCCAGWTTAHLAAHLVVRERRPDAMPGLAVEQLGVARPLTAWSHRLEDQLRESTPHADVVARLRSGPPVWSPLGWPLLARLLNTAEFVVHHEDARRAQPGWSPRALTRADQDELWGAAVLYARRAVGRVPGGLRLRRSDVPGMVRRISRAEPATTVEGEPLELLLWASGREDVARVEIS
ncbi:TIGR03085 family metal-binding protein [Geodermatophilus sp. SYSU D00742]